MDVKCPNPLDQSHCDALTKAIKANAETAALIAKMQECGLDCSEQQAQNDAVGQMAKAIKRQFFPNQS